MKLIRNIFVAIIFLLFYWLFVKSYFFDRYIFESIIYIFGLYISGHLFFIFYKNDRFFWIGLLMASIIICILSKSYDITSALQILLFHIAIWYMSKDIQFVINDRIKTDRRNLMMYSSSAFIILISVIFAIKIATVPSSFSCDVIRNQTSQAINYITLAYPRSQVKERYQSTQLDNIINGKMSNIIWIDDNLSWINQTGTTGKIFMTNGSSWYISDLSGNQPNNNLSNDIETKNNTKPNIDTKSPNIQNQILQNLSPNDTQTSSQNNDSILTNMTHNAANIWSWLDNIDIWDSSSQWILWKLQYFEKIIINNVINDRSMVDKWICEYTYDQVKMRQKHPEFLISSIILLFAILYPFFRFIFYIIGFLWWLLLILLCKLWIYKTNIYYEKVEKLE